MLLHRINGKCVGLLYVTFVRDLTVPLSWSLYDFLCVTSALHLCVISVLRLCFTSVLRRNVTSVLRLCYDYVYVWGNQLQLQAGFFNSDLSSAVNTCNSNSAPDFNIGDFALMPEHFKGKDGSHAVEWLDRLLHFTNFKKWTNAQKIKVFPLFLKDPAYLWFKDLLQSVENEFQN